MARYSSKADQICSRVPEYLKAAHRGSAKKRKAPMLAPAVRKRPVVSAWDGFAVEGTSSDTPTTLNIDDVDLDLDAFAAL